METKDGPWSIQPTYSQILGVLDTMNAGLLVRTVEGQIIFANDRMLNWLGYSPAELEAMNVRELLPDELQAGIEEELAQIHSGDERLRIGIMKRKGGRTLPIVFCPHLLRSDDTITAVVSIVMDLGEVQTAQRVGNSQASGLAGSLERIAREILTISLFAGDADVGDIPHDHPDIAQLSPREREILSKLLAGLRVPTIAEKLFISPHTVRNHLKSMYRKLEVSDQNALIQKIRSLGRTGEDSR